MDFAGFLIGLQILIKAWDKLPYFVHYPFHVGFLLLAGLFVVLGSFFHHLLEKRVKKVHAFFHLMEGAAIIVSALLLFEKGKFRLPAFILFVGCLYLVLGVIGYKIDADNYQQLGRRLLKWVGLAFIVFGSLSVIWNWNYDKDPWVFIISGIFLLFGIFYFIFADWFMKRLAKAETEQKNNANKAHEKM